MALTKAQERKKYGVSRTPIPCTRILVKPMDHDFGVPANTLLIINDDEGTFTSANVYGGNLGKGFDAEGMTHPLPAKDDAKWKKWNKTYTIGKVADWDVVKLIAKPAKVTSA